MLFFMELKNRSKAARIDGKRFNRLLDVAKIVYDAMRRPETAWQEVNASIEERQKEFGTQNVMTFEKFLWRSCQG